MTMHTAVFQSKLIYALESNIYMQMCSREGEATQNKHPLHNMDRWQNGKCTISQFGSGLVGSRFDSDAIHGRFFENGYLKGSCKGLLDNCPIQKYNIRGVEGWKPHLLWCVAVH